MNVWQNAASGDGKYRVAQKSDLFVLHYVLLKPRYVQQRHMIVRKVVQSFKQDV